LGLDPDDVLKIGSDHYVRLLKDKTVCSEEPTTKKCHVEEIIKKK
jgi:hypothetical protein